MATSPPREIDARTYRRLLALAYPIVARAWRMHLDRGSLKMPNHACQPSTCVRRDAILYSVWESSVAMELMNPEFAFFDGNDGKSAFRGYHVCVRGLCVGDEAAREDLSAALKRGNEAEIALARSVSALHTRECAHEDYLSVCTETGTMHLCSQACGEASGQLNSDNEYVCALTGRVSGSLYTDSYYVDGIASNRTKTEGGANTFTKALQRQDGSVFHGTFTVQGGGTASERIDSLLSAVLRAQDVGDVLQCLSRLRNKKNVSTREQYLCAAIAKIAILFTAKRTLAIETNIEHKEFDIHKKLEGIVRARFKEAMATRDSAKPSRPLSIVEQVMSIENCTIRAAIAPRMDLPESVKSMFVLDWARKCVRLWYIVRTRTELGRTMPDLFKFWTFIDAALSVLGNGLILVPEQTMHSCRVDLVPPDKNIMLYTRHDNVLDAGSKERQFYSRTNDDVTATKQHIATAIYNAYSITHNDNELRLSAVPTIEDCSDQDAFVKLQLPYLKRQGDAAKPPPPKRGKSVAGVEKPPRAKRTKK